MKYKYEFEIDDEFEKGDCYDCPLHYEEYYDRDDAIRCVLECNYNECPLVEIEEV